MSKITDIFKNMLLTELTANLGKVEITDDEIICYVDNKKIQKKYDNKNHVYRVDFSINKILTTELLNKYGINKPVRYVVKEIRFKDKLFFNADKDTLVSFEKCKFHKQICITGADKVIFESNKYFDRQPINTYKNFLIGRANSIIFMFENFTNCVNVHPNKLGMELFVNELKIINSKINIEEAHQDLFAMADYINIINSQISCTSARLICDNINVIGSKIVATNGIMIDEKNSDKNSSNIIESIESPSITYNGAEQQRISDEEIAMRYHRVALIKELRRIRNNCIIQNNEELKKEENRLNQKTIGQIKR